MVLLLLILLVIVILFVLALSWWLWGRTHSRYIWEGRSELQKIAPRVALLDSHWEVIRDEALALYNDKSRWGSELVRASTTWTGSDGDDLDDFTDIIKGEQKWFTAWSGGGWKNFGLIKGDKALTDLCPCTTRLLKGLGGIRIAGFSLLEPGAGIDPHTDSTGLLTNSLSYHLGLVTPPGCTLNINGRIVKQGEGKAFCFDSNRLHSASNSSDKPRIILYMDIELKKS